MAVTDQERVGPGAIPPSDDDRRRFAVEVVQRLREQGHRALWAGGCVRDLLLGLPSNDYDVATDARPEAVIRLFRRTVPVGVSFGVVKVLGPRGGGEVEVATFRSDGAYLDGRHPESVVFGGPEEDANRRDFTINGMFLDPISGEVLDYVGGRRDLEAGLLRAIGTPADRFDEDKLRLVRAVRFAARFGLRIESETQRAILAMATLIKVVAAERIAQELRKMLEHPSRIEALGLLRETGLLDEVLPEVIGTPLGASEPPDPDRWRRTLAVVGALPTGAAFPVALAALLIESDAATVGEVGRRLKLANAERGRAEWLVAQCRGLVDPSGISVAALKRLLAMPGIEDLLALHRAIAVADVASTAHVDFCESYLRDEPDGPIRPTPLIDGNDLKRLGLLPGPSFKAWLEASYDAQLEGLVRDRDEAITWIERRIEQGDGRS